MKNRADALWRFLALFYWFLALFYWFLALFIGFWLCSIGFWLCSFCFFLSSFFFCSSCPSDAGNTVAGRLQLVELIQHRNKKRTDRTWIDISVACHKLLAYGNDKTAL